MKKFLPIQTCKTLLLIGMIGIQYLTYGQVIIYQQNFDGNNGVFSNALVSQTTSTNGWLSSSTAPQYGNYRHVWNFSDVTTGGNPIVLPISGRSLGMGFWNGNSPNVLNQFFRTWDGEEPSDQTFFTTRWAHVGISTVGYENITVEFKWRCVGEIDGGTVYDYGTVNTSIDGGATWLMDQSAGQGGATSQHGTFTGGLYFGNSGVQTATLVLPASRNNKPNFRLAFRMVVDEGYGTGGGFIIDDIIVRGTPSLSTNEINASVINVYRDGEFFIIKSPEKNIKHIEVYDASGRKIIKHNETGKEVRLNANKISSGIYIVKAILENGTEITKKIYK